MASCDRKTLLSITTIVIFFQITNAELVIKPTDAEALVDDVTYFNCSTSITSQEIHWFHFRVGNSGDRNFVYGYNQFYNAYKDRFTVEKNEATGAYNLIIRSVQVQDAGIYECQDDIGRGAKASARLIVLDKLPVCHSSQKTNEVIGPNECNIPLGELQLTCSVIYHGDDAPLLKWFQDDSDKPLVDGVSSSASGNRVLSNLTLKAESITDGSSFQCRTTRSRLTSYNCSSGSFKIIGASEATCSSRKPLIDAILVICLFLIPIIIAASVLGGIFLQTRRPLSIFSGQGFSFTKDKTKADAKIAKPLEPLLEGTEAQPEEDVPVTSESIEMKEHETLPEKNEQAMEDQSKQREQLMAKIGQLSKDLKKEKNRIVELENKNKQLQDEKRELEGWLYPTATTSYDVKPTLVTKIKINDLKADHKKEKKPIFGMTILRNKLCVVIEKSSKVAVYDSVTFNFETTWPIDNMYNPLDITSCNTNDCLYICDGESDKEKVILRVDSREVLLIKWTVTIGQDEGRLSVTREANVVVSLFNGNKINEYSPDGIFIRTVRLSPADNISHPWHAIKTTSMHFIFSHGIGNDPLQRVCVADVDGKIRKSFGGKKGSDLKEQHMNRPVHLLEDSSRNVLVADMKNKRVLLLSPTLEFKGILVLEEKGGLKFPMRLCLDEEKGILFVADNSYKEQVYTNGRILIFNCKTKQSKSGHDP